MFGRKTNFRQKSCPDHDSIAVKSEPVRGHIDRNSVLRIGFGGGVPNISFPIKEITLTFYL